MKARIITAKYEHIFHLEAILQEAIDTTKAVPLPPIERPHILHYLLNKIGSGSVFIVVEEGKPVGFSVVDAATYPWNTQRVMAVGFMAVRDFPHDHVIEIEQLLLLEMSAYSHRNGAHFSPLRMPGIRIMTSNEDMVKMGAVVDGDSIAFLLPPAMEN